MAHAEKELEAQLVEVGNRLASPPSDVNELLSLLDQAESFLSRVEQLPSQSMSTALYPAMKALVAKDLLNHSEVDVKVYVASCFSQITRITAPDAPYNDNLMKDIFHVIVDVFENLNDLSTHSYSKRVSILETAANVRSCVVMLDLECNDLILEMFQHFLKTIRASHTGNVFSLMVTVMTLILEESEDISSELLCCLLDSVKKANTDVLPIARRLGEKVISNSAAKLKRYLVKLVQSMGVSLSDYSNIVASICQENPDTQDLNELNSFDDCLAANGKLSRRTLSDELPQGSANLEPEVDCPGKIGAITEKSPMLVLCNGTVSIGNGDSIKGTNSPKQKPEPYSGSGQSKSTIAGAIAEPNELDLAAAVKLDSLADHITKKRIGRKSNSAIQLSCSQTNSDKAAPAVSSRRRDRRKEADVLQPGAPSGKGAEASRCLQPEEKAKLGSSVHLDSRTVCITSPTPDENIPDVTRPKKRLFGSKVTAKKGGVNAVIDQPVSTSGQKEILDNYLTEEARLPSENNETKKDEMFSCDSVRKTLSRSGKMVLKENAHDGEKPSADLPPKKELNGTIDSEAKNLRKRSIKGSTRNITEREPSEELQKSKSTQQKGSVITVKVEAEELSLKEMISARRSWKALTRDQYHLKESIRTKSKRKCAMDTVEVSEAQNRGKELNEYLVGSKIKIWWPDDKVFYAGVVDSFDPVSKKHKILYFDGDMEILLLKDERWKLIEDVSKTDRVHAKYTPSPDISTEMPPKKKTKASSDLIAKQGTETTLRSGGRPASQSRADDIRSGGNNDLSKTRERPETRYSKAGSTSIDETSEALRRSKENVARKYENCDNFEDDIIKLGSRFRNFIRKTSTNLKDETPKSGGRTKSKDEAPKRSTESKEDSPKTASKPKDVAVDNVDKPETWSAKTASKFDGRTPKAGWKLRSASALRRSGDESDPNATSAKGNSKKQENDDSAAKGEIRSSRVTRRKG